MNAWITVTINDDLEAVVSVTPEQGAEPLTERVDLGMNPTWPNIEEVADMVSAAVRTAILRESEYFS